MPLATLIHGSPDDIEAAYYDALAKADLETLMSLWSDDEETICIHPGAPRLVGHIAIRAAWENILVHGGLHIRPRLLHAIHNITSAVHSVIEEMYYPRHEEKGLYVIATNIYIKTTLGWRIALHHASVAQGTIPSDPMTETVLH